MGSTGEERRARRAKERRQGILEAAARVFARKGFEKATTREIAQEADVSEGTIYNYFASKQQLLMALASMIREELTAVIPRPQIGGDDRAIITEAVDHVLAIITENALVIRGLLTALWDRGQGFQGYLIPGAHDLIARVEDYLRICIAAGAIRSCDVQAVARMVMGMVVYLSMPYVRDLEPAPSAEERRRQAELLVSILFDGLRTQEG